MRDNADAPPEQGPEEPPIAVILPVDDEQHAHDDEIDEEVLVERFQLAASLLSAIQFAVGVQQSLCYADAPRW